MKILLVEDHAALAEISCNQLREIYSHEVVHAATGAAALEALKTFEPELVLLDIHLPDMLGYAVAREMRANSKHNGVVIVALTGFGSQVSPSLAAAVGIDLHFRKPMDFELPTLKRNVSPA